MTMELSHSVPAENEPLPTSLERFYPGLWNEIESVEHTPEATRATHIGNIQSAAQLALRQYNELTEPTQRSDAYYRAHVVTELLPSLTDIKDKEHLTKEELRYHGEAIRSAAARALGDILGLFTPGTGVTLDRSTSLIGLINEITPLGLYSRGNTLVLPASHKQDLYERTDVIAYQFDDEGNKLRAQPIQCKTNKRYTQPIDGIPLLDAKDFNNRVNVRLGVHHDNETSLLLVEEEMGIISAPEKAYLDDLSADLWDILDERLTPEFQERHRRIAHQALLNVRFSQNIPNQAFERYL